MLYLDFPLRDTVGVDDTVAVDMASFEHFVQQSEKDGKSFDQLTLSHVEFEDGTLHDLTLTWEIWVGSILPASKRLRGSYFAVNVGEKARESKLRRIKENNPDLWSRITYWVDDFGNSVCARTTRDAVGTRGPSIHGHVLFQQR